MSYQNRVLSVATRACGSRVPFAGRVVELWKSLEAQAAALPRRHDLFAPTPQLRETMRQLTSLLYEVPGASPSADAEQIAEKNRLYGESWCRRGGDGAFHMLARKADRFMETPTGDHEDTLGDLRRYLILVEAMLEEQETPKVEPLEEVGEQIEKQFSASLCDECSHHSDNHPLTSGYHSACRATGCDCTGFVSRKT